MPQTSGGLHGDHLHLRQRAQDLVAVLKGWHLLGPTPEPDGISVDPEFLVHYPLVTNIAMENHYVSWKNPLEMVIFHSYVKLPEGNK